MGERSMPPNWSRNRNNPRHAGFWAAGRNVEKIWTHVLTNLGARFGVRERLEKDCVDPNLHWYRAGNLWHNAGLGSVLYAMVAQARIVSGLLRRRT